ncbi:MAG: hypothetical protein Q9M94_03680 [Candidatus Gracilibacteria bacterium]|nr:hypothetical protein [Candidatus Gracilibacteria bacterium]MDQ7023498.1 hypothetical protein [Candidatus Gracilibacteria bacterium]
MTNIMDEIQKIQLENSIGMKELRVSQKETDRQMEKSNEEFDKRMKESELKREKSNKEFDKRMKEVQKELGGIGNSQEEVGVDLFRRNMKNILAKKGIKIDITTTRFKNSVRLEDGTFLQGEYDLMGINGKDIVVVEVKNKLKDDHIDKFLNIQLPRFKILFPQYKNYNLYGGIGSLIVGEHQERKAEKQGLFVFTQGKDGNAMIMNNDNFVAKTF